MLASVVGILKRLLTVRRVDAQPVFNMVCHEIVLGPRHPNSSMVLSRSSCEMASLDLTDRSSAF